MPGNVLLTDHWRNAVRDWRNFHAPSMSIVNLLCSGHHLKMFLFLLEEMAYARVDAHDIDGLWVMVYEVAEMRYCLRKRSPNLQNMTWGDAMSHRVLGDLAGQEKLAWAVFDGTLATGVSPELGPDESCERVVCGIFDKLVPLRPVPRDYRRCKGHAGTRCTGGGTHNVQPPPGLRARPEYQQGVPDALCKINGFWQYPRTSGVPKEAGH